MRQVCSSCGHIKMNGHYSEVTLSLNNGSKMPIAVCHDCKDQVHLKDKKQIMDAVREGWKREQIRDRWSKERMDKYDEHFGKLEIV